MPGYEGNICRGTRVLVPEYEGIRGVSDVIVKVSDNIVDGLVTS